MHGTRDGGIHYLFRHVLLALVSQLICEGILAETLCLKGESQQAVLRWSEAGAHRQKPGKWFMPVGRAEGFSERTCFPCVRSQEVTGLSGSESELSGREESWENPYLHFPVIPFFELGCNNCFFFPADVCSSALLAPGWS